MVKDKTGSGIKPLKASRAAVSFSLIAPSNYDLVTLVKHIFQGAPRSFEGSLPLTRRELVYSTGSIGNFAA